MRTVNYSEVLRGTAAKCGFLATDIDAAQFALFREFHDARLQLAWELHDWPDVCLTEQRSFRIPWSASTAIYNPGDEVLDVASQSYFQCLQTQVAGVTVTGSVHAVLDFTYGYAGVDANGNAYYLSPDTSLVIYNNGGTWAIAFTTPTPYVPLWTMTAPSATPVSNTWMQAGGQVWPGMTSVLAPQAQPPTINGVENSAYWAQSQPYYTAQDWASGTSYVVGDQVYDVTTVTAYQCISAHTSGASIDYTQFGALTPFNRYVAYNQSWEANEIAECFLATDHDWRVTTKLTKLPFELSADGLQFTRWTRMNTIVVSQADTNAYVWLYFRKGRPVLTGDVFDPTLVYVSGQQVYYTSTATNAGNFYTATTTTTAGDTPDSAPAKWSVVQLPYIFRSYLIQGGYEDWLKSDGNVAAGDDEESTAEMFLEQEIDKLVRQQGQVKRFQWR